MLLLELHIHLGDHEEVLHQLLLHRLRLRLLLETQAVLVQLLLERQGVLVQPLLRRQRVLAVLLPRDQIHAKEIEHPMKLEEVAFEQQEVVYE